MEFHDEILDEIYDHAKEQAFQIKVFVNLVIIAFITLIFGIICLVV
jgi:hypothetical protein